MHNMLLSKHYNYCIILYLYLMFVEIPQTFMIMWLLWVIHNGKYNVLLKTTLNKFLISFYFNSNSSILLPTHSSSYYYPIQIQKLPKPLSFLMGNIKIPGDITIILFVCTSF